ncbi:hypothetical protein [Mitsuaria sp. GD03876]|uniref:hypothetical protein n=1 Tax=Mitsuaria sp. GD03876 TaxID=2975399 RepID=UPI00244A0485|nr:hypothetical protein [Mitsuaria sp. GD03876]MDH0863345.1 hypothetical protein [Mitsuaria sp. GD03876]
MPTLTFQFTTTLTPTQFIAGLTDFGPGRSKVFRYSSDDMLQVHRRGRSQAVVTEGTPGIWERLHYDWSDPAEVVLKTTDSNVWGGRSGHRYTFETLPDGRTRLTAVVIREGKNLKGRLLGVMLGTLGRGTLERALADALQAMEAAFTGVTVPSPYP